MREVYVSPGPWVYRPYPYDDWGMVRDAQGWPVCQASTNALPNDTDLGAFRRSGTDPVEGNARLIAGAPAMHAALVEIARLRTELSGDFSRSSHQSDIARKALAAVAGGVMAPETVGPEPVDSQSMSSPVQRSEPKTCSGSTSNG